LLVCDYCGCQALDAVSTLTAEHDDVSRVSAAITAALGSGSVAEAAELCRDLAAVLGPHTRVEEDALFPAMSGDFPDHVTDLRGEHRAVEAVLAEASDGTPADPTWPERLTAALHLLRDHVSKEENGVFPAALGVLTPDDWERLEEVRRQVGRRRPAAVPVPPG
jgi:hypothetical protein